MPSEHHAIVENILRLFDAGQFEQAERQCDEVLEQFPENSEVSILKGQLLFQRQAYHESCQHFKRHLSFESDNAVVWMAYGQALNYAEQYREAAQALETCVQLNAQLAEAHIGLAHAYYYLKQWYKAEKSYEQGWVLGMKHQSVCLRLSKVKRHLSKSKQSLLLCQEALQRYGEQAEIYSELALVYSSQADLKGALGAYAKAMACDPKRLDMHSNYLVLLNYCDDINLPHLLEMHEQWAQKCSEATWEKPETHLNERDKCHVAYVSADFNNHACSYFLLPLLKHHDRQAFHITCISSTLREDEVSQEIESLCDNFYRALDLSDEAVFEWIREQKIDILVDMNGHTSRNRLHVFARKAAPIQATWLGYGTTTGLNTIDYKISDAWLSPPDIQEGFSENICLLDGVLAAYEPWADAPEVEASPCLKKQTITFGSMNSLLKISDACLALWAKVLEACEGSQLMMKAIQSTDPETQALLKARLQKAGIQEDRLLIVEYQPGLKEHLQMYSHMDIALDSFPYNGATTTCEALWMGVPVMSMVGNRYDARMGYSMLTAAGFPQWVADSETTFIKLCVEMASLSSEELNQQRMSMREKLLKSDLMDGQAHAKSMEKLYRQWIQTFNQGD